MFLTPLLPGFIILKIFVVFLIQVLGYFGCFSPSSREMAPKMVVSSTPLPGVPAIQGRQNVLEVSLPPGFSLSDISESYCNFLFFIPQ